MYVTGGHLGGGHGRHKIKHAETIDQIKHKYNKSDEPTLRESKED